ncbi:MAG: hypothetical protein ACD_81C00179G0004 [uncultured bacterium]|uniref:Cohesin domain-containing protein n=2 Tax=Candidatus Wolfeibacteriota TaxID=1752735 RepID=A0A0G1H937_9BACT|nr:MAG: hypothetical protein ACD_81C00179G0004 [uncultured bacterium]KKR12963.1 MAG: hypothetical protein UT41_C0001G0507 [Candidatus Wolfebacteria bacterium GW2011_GWC2_39_22]KKT43891.1 MAG: hypothetical protein UW32_C0001G0483 [Candidatus Wolfebacteria bacterium GW2011_GWE2_44_13]HBI25382.1 hypothetical protein [Candidatus Wolfebacteria bacterium]
MNRVMKYKFALLVASIAFLFTTIQAASAATLQLSTTKDTFVIGDQFTVSVLTDSEGVGVNAAQGTVQISKDVLEIVSVDKTGSVFNFWLTEPTFSNDSGQVSFLGGSTSGFSGRSLQIIKITYKVKGSGKTDIVFTDGAVTASDGSGTNVLSSMRGLSITSVPSTELETIAPKPVQIVRPAEPAARVPAKPEIQVAGYRDPEAWYNFATRFSASWQLSNDITAIATEVNKDPTFIPTESEGLFDNKIFQPLGEGVWYLHVRFRNNVGWSQTLHYRIAIDLTPPPAFQAKIREGGVTDHPDPTIEFAASDGLSGLKGYYIQENNGEVKDVTESPYKLDLHKPGLYTVKVGAIDRAGNSVESILSLEILPIEAPKITSITRNIFVGEGNLEVLGFAIPDVGISVSVRTEGGQVEQLVDTHADDHGSWAVSMDKPLKTGKYIVEVIAKDARGALSLPVTSEVVTVKQRPVLILGSLEITQFWFFTLLIVILLGGFGAAWLYVRLKEAQQARKVIIAQRDIANAIATIKKDVDGILAKYADDKIDETEVSEIQYLAKKISTNLDRARKYIVEDIGDINK